MATHRGQKTEEAHGCKYTCIGYQKQFRIEIVLNVFKLKSFNISRKILE
jgi:hypothetical protein